MLLSDKLFLPLKNQNLSNQIRNGGQHAPIFHQPDPILKNTGGAAWAGISRRKKGKVKSQQFDFLGYTFRPRKLITKDGKIMFGFSPSISRKSTRSIVATCRKLGFHRWTHLNIHQLSKALVSKIRGWLYYYGKFHISALRQAFRLINRRLVKWAFNKYKRYKRTKSLRTARLWLRQVSKHYAYLFPHWLLGFRP